MIHFDFFVGSPRTLFQRTYLDKLRTTFNHGGLLTDESKSLQPRLIIQEAYSPTDPMIAKYEEVFKYYNPLTLYIDAPTVTIKGTVTELGAPVLNRRVMVRLTSPDGRYTERTFTDLEGNFVFYEIPQNLSLMAIAVDATYKYNAVILSKIQTILDGE